MPELPEVEVTRRGVAPHIEGRVVEGAVLRREGLRWPFPPGLSELLAGRRIIATGRRGKYLLIEFEHGTLIVHLGMSGHLRVLPPGIEPRKHDHFDLVGADPEAGPSSRQVLRLHDPRRFGAVVWAAGEDDPAAHKLLKNLGPEPLDGLFPFDAFFAGLQASRAPVKLLLLSGKIVVGVGNIYASEVLFLSGIRPTARASSIGPIRARRLHAAIQQVLARAVERGGSTLRDFSSADGNAGHFQVEANVYGRDQQPCRVCGTPIRLLRQGQRSTFYCIRCQRG